MGWLLLIHVRPNDGVEVDDRDSATSYHEIVRLDVAVCHPHPSEAGADAVELCGEVRDGAKLARAVVGRQRHPSILLPNRAVHDVHAHHGGQVHCTAAAEYLVTLDVQQASRLDKERVALAQARRHAIPVAVRFVPLDGDVGRDVEAVVRSVRIPAHDAHGKPPHLTVQRCARVRWKKNTKKKLQVKAVPLCSNSQ